MIISHSKKAIFWRTPKTASETATLVFRLAGLLDKDSDRDFCTAGAESGLPGINIPTSLKYEMDHDAQMRRLIQAKGQKLRKEIIENPETDSTLELGDEEKEFIKKSNEQKHYPFSGPPIIHSTADTFIDGALKDHNIITRDELYEYDNYAYIRNPIKRFVSAYVFQQKVSYEIAAKRGKTLPPFDYLFHIDDFHNVVKNLKDKYFAKDRVYSVTLYRPQIDFFRIEGETHKDGKRLVEPLLFEDMVNEGNRMLKNHGCFSEVKEWPKLNTQAEQGKQIGFSEKPEAASWVDPYPEIKELLLDFYKEDVELWEELSGEKV